MRIVGLGDEPVGVPQRALLLSVDFEDWHQLVRRRVGDPDWSRPGPALERQTDALLHVFERLGVRSTFFILGMAARAHPELVRRVAGRGHDIACHGDEHRPVHSQTAEQFREDLRRARATIEELTGVTPVGYRAPAFSIDRRTPWALEVLQQEGFAYDASRSGPDWPGASAAPAGGPHRLRDGRLWEFPVAVWDTGRVRLTVGGASYWTVTPTAVVLRGLSASAQYGGLYLHPHEFDPEPLRADLTGGAALGSRVRARLRAVQRNANRRRADSVLRAIADRFRLMTYGEAHAQLSTGVGTRS